MPKIVIVGGKLQGSEAAYLGKEAGIDIILIDKDPLAPAQKLCAGFICGDVLSNDKQVVCALESADMILPTLENDQVLKGLTVLCKKKGYVMAFDWEAYAISSSKRISDRLFATNKLPCPLYYPDGDFPYIAKPDAESGSHGVQYFQEEKALTTFLECGGDSFILQEFLAGPSYSIEIIGTPGNYRTYEITRIFTDDVYDCNLAATHHTIEPKKKETIIALAVEIAELIHLNGIMDLEVIDHHGEIKILEIDARLPSQTAIVVYHASGMNYIKELYDLFCKGKFMDEQINRGRCASLTHYLFDGEACTSHGEHIMMEGGILKFCRSICRDAVVITDFHAKATAWRGTFINWADTLDDLKSKERQMCRELESQFGIVKGGVADGQ